MLCETLGPSTSKFWSWSRRATVDIHDISPDLSLTMIDDEITQGHRQLSLLALEITTRDTRSSNEAKIVSTKHQSENKELQFLDLPLMLMGRG